MKKLLFFLLLSSTTWADTEGRVVDEAGAPIAGATIRVGGTVVATSPDGTFSIAADSDIMSLRVDADGYFGFIHTVTDSDAGLPDIVLVKREPDRRLLMFAGDAMLSRRYFEPRADEPVLVSRGSVLEDSKRLLEVIRPYVELADFASLNLETVLADKQPGERLPKSVTFFSPPEIAEALKWAGFDYAALGNNHTYDYRDGGVRTTIAALDATALPYSGVGTDEASARRPFIAPVSGLPFAHLSYVGWAGMFSPSQAAKGDKGGAALGNARVFAEDLSGVPDETVAVLQLHRGIEYAEIPARTERTSLREAIDFGADLAIGHHAHVLQGFEIYNDRLIAYSLGNFLFDQYHYTTQLGMLLYVWMDGDRFHRAEIVPLDINGYVPTPATGAFRYAVLNRLARLSEETGICLTASGMHGVVSAASATPCAMQTLLLPDVAGTELVLGLAGTNASPFKPVAVDVKDAKYRVGTNILPRGDFETAGLYGTTDRSWIEADGISLVDDGSTRMSIVADRGETVRAGMKVFERTFTISNPATVSGKLRVEGDAEVRFYLQRRRTDDGLDEALDSGPLIPVGALSGTTDGWHNFSLDFEHPRVSTRSVRLLVDVTAPGDSTATVDLDDVAWVEWHTPWLQDGGDPVFGSHVQVRPSR